MGSLHREASLAWLAGLDSYERTGSLTAPTTRRVEALVEALGAPHRAYPVVHVTGTNGKGSTAAMTAALLGAAGLRVGTYTSPHIERLTERITVAGEEVDADALADAVAEVARVADDLALTPTWFEALTAAGLWLLAASHVDVAVVEVGMLGRWDATNVVDAAVAVITTVELYHTEMAGPTRADIAREKAGIIKPGATLVLGENDPALREIFAAAGPARTLTLGQELSATRRGLVAGGTLADLANPWGTHEEVVVAMGGDHQVDNALLALTAAEAFTGRAVPAAVATDAFAGARLPGRFEVVGRDPVVIVDGAHNPAAAAALRRAVETTFPAAQRLVVVYGALAGREPVAFLEQLGVRPVDLSVDLLVATEPDSPRAVRAEDLADAGRGLGARTRVVVRPEEALREAVDAAGADGLVLVTGSLHLVGAVRAAAMALR